MIDILYQEYSGFFPFPIYKDADLPAAGIGTGAYPRNVMLPLASLCKLFWRAKSYDITIDLNCKTTMASGQFYVFHITGTRTCVVSQVFSSFEVYPATPSDRTAPPDRATYPRPYPSQIDPSITFPYTYTLHIPDPSGGPDNTFDYTSDLQGGLNWFGDIFPDPSMPGPTRMTLDASGNYLTACQGNFADYRLPFYFVLSTYDDPNPGLVDPVYEVPYTCTLTAANATLRAEGVNTTLPIYIRKDTRSGSPTTTVTGTVLFDFNQFYM